MPHVSPTLPNDGEDADAEDISVPFSLLLAIFNGHIAADNIEPGSLPWSVMDSFTDTIEPSAMKDTGNIEKFRAETGIGFIASGLTWSDLGVFAGGMATGVYYSPTTGARISVPAITSRNFTASKDTYVSISPTGSIAYQEVTNGATAPTLGTNYSWVAKVVTNGSEITSVSDIRQTKPFANQEAWIALTTDNGWVDFTDANFETKLYVRKDSQGIVHIKGIVKGTSASSLTICNAGRVPLGYRPIKTVIYPCLADDNPGRFDIQPDGAVKFNAMGGDATPNYLSLAGEWFGEI